MTASGYVYREHGAEPGKGNPGTIVSVTPGQSLQGITLRPIRDNILSGRVTSTAGELFAPDGGSRFKADLRREWLPILIE